MVPESEQSSPVMAVEQAEVLSLPLLNRRPKTRTREVSSRFMSPLVPSKAIPSSTPTPTPAPDCHHLKSLQRLHHMQEGNNIPASRINANKMETTHCLKSVQKWQGDEEQDNTLILQSDVKMETTQCITSIPAVVAFGSHNHHSDTKAATSVYSVRKRNQQRVTLKENSEGAKEEQEHPTGINSETRNSTLIARSKTSCSRPDTPTTLVADRDRIIPSRYKLNSRSSSRDFHYPNAANVPSGGVTVSAAAKLLKEAIHVPGPLKSSATRNQSSDDMAIVLQNKLSRMSRSADDSCGSYPANVTTQMGGSCPSSPLLLSSNRRGIHNVHSSLQDADVLANMSTRSISERNPSNFHCGKNINNIDSSMIRVSPCSRSLDFPASRGELASSTSLFRLRASNSTTASTTFKPSGENHMGLPPHPSSIKLVPDIRKGRKHHEEVHFLKLLYNHYLKWRFANARAEALMCSQEMETKRRLNSLGSKLSELRISVRSKSMELECLRRSKALANIVNSQMLYLNQWSALEEDYSTSLSEVVNSLHNLSLRLPISGEVKVDIRELGEAVNMAIRTMEMMIFNIKSYVATAEEVGSLSSELARVVNGERVLIHDCGHRLIKAYTSQVEECSMRGHLIQLRRSNYRQSQKENKVSSQKDSCFPLGIDHRPCFQELQE